MRPPTVSLLLLVVSQLLAADPVAVDGDGQQAKISSRAAADKVPFPNGYSAATCGRSSNGNVFGPDLSDSMGESTLPLRRFSPSGRRTREAGYRRNMASRDMASRAEQEPFCQQVGRLKLPAMGKRVVKTTNMRLTPGEYVFSLACTKAIDIIEAVAAKSPGNEARVLGKAMVGKLNGTVQFKVDTALDVFVLALFDELDATCDAALFLFGLW